MIRSTVMAMVSVLLPLWREGLNEVTLSREVDRVGLFVLSQLSKMPDLLRSGVNVLLVVFALSGVLYAGRLFFWQTAQQRKAQVVAWMSSSVAMQRDVVRLVASLAAMSALGTEEASRAS